LLYTVVDIETTGNGYKGSKITEISIFVFDVKKREEINNNLK
jgi:DNA polymerase-3 subunit epsilon